MDGWMEGREGAVDARAAVAVGRYFRTVRSATKGGQAAEGGGEGGRGKADKRTDVVGESYSYRPGSVKGREDSERRTSP